MGGVAKELGGGLTMNYDAIALNLLVVLKTAKQLEAEQTKYAPEDWAKIINAMHRINAERQED